MRLSISEILQQVSEAKSKQEKIGLLRQHDSQALRTILVTCFSPNYVWLLPPGEIPYKSPDPLDAEGRLIQETKKFYLFFEGGNPNLTPKKREQIFIQILESVSASDATLLMNIKDKCMPYKGVTAKLVKEAFPGLL